MAVIRVDFARARLADSGRSEAFENQIESLREARAWTRTGFLDHPRYARATIDRLVWALVGRGPDLRDAIYQLSHLLRAAGALGARGGALGVLFGLEGPAHAAVLAGGLARAFERRPDLLRPTEGGVLLQGGENAPYRIAAARLPLLIALLEILIGLDLDDAGRAERDAALAAAETSAPDRAALTKASNRLAAALSRWLDGALRSRAARDRFAALARFLDARAEPGARGAPPSWRLDDEAVLGFWEAQAAEAEEAELRLFRSAHRAFVALSTALAEGEAWRGLHAAALDIDAPDALDLDPDEVADGAPDLDGPLAALETPPLDRVKLLNRAEREGLEIVDGPWRLGPHLPLSALRSAAMGRTQGAILNALRFRRQTAPLLDLPPPGPDDPYASQIAAWAALATHLMQARLAAAHVVAHHAGVEPPAMAEEARRAFRSFRREGFAGALDDPALGAAFGDAIAPLARLSSLVESLTEALPADARALYAADAPRFAAAFRAIHGLGE